MLTSGTTLPETVICWASETILTTPDLYSLSESSRWKVSFRFAQEIRYNVIFTLKSQTKLIVISYHNNSNESILQVDEVYTNPLCNDGFIQYTWDGPLYKLKSHRLSFLNKIVFL